MGVFQEAIFTLNDMGFLDVIVPFILVFTIVFAVLQKTKILGTEMVGTVEKPRKNFNVIIALVMGMAVIFPHILGTVPAEQDVVLIINSALPNVSAVLVAIIMLLLMIGVFGGDVKFANTSLSGWAVLFAIVATVVIFGSSANWFGLPPWLYWLDDYETKSMIIVILVFGAIIWFITKEDKPKDYDQGGIAELAKVMGWNKAKP